MSSAARQSALAALISLAVCVVVWAWPHSATAQPVDPVSGLDAVYAETLPLASRSLLLDVMRLENGRLVAVGERGHIVWSDDGENWQQAEHVPTRSTLTAITGFKGRLWAVGHDTTILTSGDQGKTWTLQYFDPERQQAAMDVHFTGPAEGMVIGAYGLYLRTDDGGANWDDYAVSDEEWHLNGLLDLGGGRLMIAGEAGYTYRSEDGGETWEVTEMPYPGSMFGIVAAGRCVLVFGLRGNVQESCDGGDNWTELETGTQQSLSGGAYHQDELLLVGNGGIVLHRQGRGPFTVNLHSSGVDFASVVHLDDGSWLLVGEEGYYLFPEPAAAPDGDS